MRRETLWYDRDLLSERWTRRVLLRRLLASGIAIPTIGALLTACQQEPAATPTAAPATPTTAATEPAEPTPAATTATPAATPQATPEAEATEIALSLGGSDWAPERPVTFICPWAAGGGTDRVARTVATLLERRFGQPFNVVNRTGGSGAVGHTAGATAEPDGHTITIVTVEIAMMHWLGLTEVSPQDFAPAAQVNFDPAGVQVRADAPWNTLQELLDDARANPGQYKASGTGQGGIWHVALAGMLKTAGLPVDAIPWVPSEGAAPALQELVAGGVDVVTASLPEGGALIEAGQVKPLAIMAEERSPQFPDVPTLKELGIDWVMGAWRGIALPKDTETHIVAAYEQAMADVVQADEFVEFMQNNGFGIMWRNAQDFAAFMAEQDELMGALMKDLGLAS